MITTTWDSFQSVLNEFSNAHFLMCFFYITLGLALHSIHLPVRKFYTFLCSSFYTIHYLFLHSFIVCAVFFHQFGTQTYSDSWRMSLGPFQTNQFFPIPPCFSASGFNFFFFFLVLIPWLLRRMSWKIGLYLTLTFLPLPRVWTFNSGKIYYSHGRTSLPDARTDIWVPGNALFFVNWLFFFNLFLTSV